MSCIPICALAGQANVKQRSLLSGHEGYVTFSFQADWTMERPGYVFGFLRRRFEEATVNQVSRMRLTLDQKGAVFDLPAELADDFLARCGSFWPPGATHMNPRSGADTGSRATKN